MLLPNIPPVASTQVAVVGAGMAGLACAEALADAGHNVSLFEKSRGLGGRMATRRSANIDNNWQCDHGVSLFEAHSAEFREKVIAWQRNGVACSIHTADMQTNVAQLYYGVPHMTSIAHHILHSRQQTSGSVVCYLNTKVSAIRRHRTGWSLSTETTGTHLATNIWQAVVLAIPAPQAASLLESTSAAYQLAQSVSMQPCWVVIVVLEHPLDLPWRISVDRDSPLEQIICDTYKSGRTGRQTWLLQARSAWSNAQLNATPESVTQQLLAAFVALGGPVTGNVQANAHRWLHATTRRVTTSTYWLDRLTGLGLCGDWLLSGDVESAWLSGCSLGRALNHWLRKMPAPPLK